MFKVFGKVTQFCICNIDVYMTYFYGLVKFKKAPIILMGIGSEGMKIMSAIFDYVSFLNFVSTKINFS